MGALKKTLQAGGMPHRHGVGSPIRRSNAGSLQTPTAADYPHPHSCSQRYSFDRNEVLYYTAPADSAERDRAHSKRVINERQSHRDRASNSRLRFFDLQAELQQGLPS